MKLLPINSMRFNLASTGRLAGIMLFPDSKEKQQEIERAYVSGENKGVLLPCRSLANSGTLSGAQLLLCIGGNISLTLARETLAIMYENKKGPTSIRALKSAWNSHKHVAHLWAAVSIMHNELHNKQVVHTFPCHPSQMSFPLFLAEEFRLKGEAFISDRARSAILDKDNTWKIPPNVRIEKKSEFEVLFSQDYPAIAKAVQKTYAGRYGKTKSMISR